MGPFAEWRRLVAEEEAASAAGLRTCCTRVGGRVTGRRICWWRGQHGNVESLCAACFDRWWADAAEDPELAPTCVMFEAT